MKTHTNRSVSSNAHKQINHYREMAQGIHQSVIQVMLVDDHELMRQGLRAILSLEDDIRVIDEVGSGRDLLSHLDAGIQPDVILMDIQMPGMSGLEATRLVALKYPNIKIVALTGALTGIENHSMKASMLQAGAVDYVTKTEAASQLVHVIRDVAQEDQDVLLDTASQSTGMHSMAHAMVVNSNGKAQNDPVQYGHSESVQSTYHRGPAGDVDVYSTNGNSADGYKYVMRQDVFGTVGLHRPFEDKLESMTTKQEEPCKLTRRELDVMKTLMKGYTNKEIARSLIISERTVQTHLRNIFSKMEVNSRTEAILVAMRDGWVPVAV